MTGARILHQSQTVGFLTALVCIMLFVPTTSIILDINLNNFAVLAAIVVIGLWVLSFNKTAVVPYGNVIIFLISLFILGIQLLRGQGFVLTTGGLYVFLLIVLFELSLQKLRIDRIIELQDNLRTLILWLAWFVFLESVVLLLGGGETLRSLFSSGNSFNYKLHNSADFLNWVLQSKNNIPGPNSIFFGTQMAPLIVMLAAFLFRNRPILCVLFACVFTLISNLTTISIALVLLCFLLIKKMRPKAFLLILLSAFSLVFCSLYFKIIGSRVFWNVNAISIDKAPQYLQWDNIDPSFFEQNGLNYYWWSFYSPINGLIKQDTVAILFGTNVEFRSYNLITSDFGYAHDTLFLCGIFWFLLISSFIVSCFIPSLTLYFKHRTNNCHIYADSLLMVGALALSMVHYNHVMQNAPVTILFCLATAICIRLGKTNR